LEGLNISELRLMTGPAGADEMLVGAVGDGAAWALQPARPAAAMRSEAAPMRSLRRTG
jgi:hypothetical protein